MRLHSLSLIAAVMAFAVFLNGCGPIYTGIYSESRLESLSVPMSKQQVQDEIGRPDKVMFDDGRVLTWRYKLYDRYTWAKELALCPITIIYLACIFYPITEFSHADPPKGADYYDVVFVDGQLCMWGRAQAISGRKECAAPIAQTSRPAPPLKPLVLASGVITSGNIDNYKVLAVPAFAEARNATGSGAVVADITSTLLLGTNRFTIIERVRLDQLFEEQKTQLKSSDERGFVASVGKLTGARAVVLGNVNQWETRTENNRNLSTVSLSLRLVDVDTGSILFAGQGTFAQPLLAPPEQVAHGILNHILGKLLIQAGILPSGKMGFQWKIMHRSGIPRAVVTALETGLPAEKSGLKVDDIILSCNGGLLEKQTDTCKAEVGHEMSLEVLRGEERLTIRATAVDRF